MRKEKQMKAIIEFNLPEEAEDHKYALAGVDALLLIDDLLNEIRSYMKHDCGDLKEYRDEDGKFHPCCHDTLDHVRDWIWQEKNRRNLPALT